MATDLKTIVAENLNDLAIEAGTNANAISTATGITKSVLYRAMQAEHVPDAAFVVILAKFFGVSTDRILLSKEDRNVGVIKEARSKGENRKGHLGVNRASARKSSKNRV